MFAIRGLLAASKAELEANILRLEADLKPLAGGDLTIVEVSVIDETGLDEGIRQVYQYLRDKTGKRHIASIRCLGVRYLRARMRDGFSVADCKTAVDNCFRAWNRNPEMVRFIRAQTIFRPRNFAGYLDGSSPSLED